MEPGIVACFVVWTVFVCSCVIFDAYGKIYDKVSFVENYVSKEVALGKQLCLYVESRISSLNKPRGMTLYYLWQEIDFLVESYNYCQSIKELRSVSDNLNARIKIFDRFLRVEFFSLKLAYEKLQLLKSIDARYSVLLKEIGNSHFTTEGCDFVSWRTVINKSESQLSSMTNFGDLYFGNLFEGKLREIVSDIDESYCTVEAEVKILEELLLYKKALFGLLKNGPVDDRIAHMAISWFLEVRNAAAALERAAAKAEQKEFALKG